MSWHYRLPQAFPAMYPQIIRSAVQNLNTPLILTHGTAREVKAVAATLRWFRWCVKEDPGASIEFSNIFETFDIRTSTEYSGNSILLYVTAKPTKISEFIRLNPDLASDVLSECQ